MRKILLVSGLLLLALGLQAQKLNCGVRLGGLYGGPVPTNVPPDSSEGTPGLGPSVAAFLTYQLSEKFRLRVELGYAYRGADYSLLIRNDTNVTIELLPGIVDTVPSFYFADVNGSMDLHYLELPILLQYEVLAPVSIDIGLNFAYLLAGSDQGEAKIQIGEGGIFEDRVEAFENFPDEMQRLDVGVMLGATYPVYRGLEIQLRGYRSLTGLYRKGFFDSQGLPGNRNYHTQFYFGAGWQF